MNLQESKPEHRECKCEVKNEDKNSEKSEKVAQNHLLHDLVVVLVGVKEIIILNNLVDLLLTRNVIYEFGDLSGKLRRQHLEAPLHSKGLEQEQKTDVLVLIVPLIIRQRFHEEIEGYKRHQMSKVIIEEVVLRYHPWVPYWEVSFLTCVLN